MQKFLHLFGGTKSDEITPHLRSRNLEFGVRRFCVCRNDRFAGSRITATATVAACNINDKQRHYKRDDSNNSQPASLNSVIRLFA
jgi:hypothetical protein